MNPSTQASGPTNDSSASAGAKTAPRSWFAAPGRLQLLAASAESWVGTPFFPHGRNKGPQGGVSCQTLVSLVYVEAGFLSLGWQIPTGPIETGFRPMIEAVDGLLSAHFTPVQEIAPGDLVCFRLARQGHLGIAIDESRFVHCLRNTGVTVSRLDDATYLKMVARIWRPTTPMQ